MVKAFFATEIIDLTKITKCILNSFLIPKIPKLTEVVYLMYNMHCCAAQKINLLQILNKSLALSKSEIILLINFVDNLVMLAKSKVFVAKTLQHFEKRMPAERITTETQASLATRA